jgi:rare lipoprotein A (peptidoglycan hydrolase)
MMRRLARRLSPRAAWVCVLGGLVLSGCSTVTPVPSAAAHVVRDTPQVSAQAVPASAEWPGLPAVPSAGVSQPATQAGAEGSSGVPPTPEAVSPAPIAAPAVSPALVLSDTDPVPRIEAAHRGANRPYQLAGRQYVPRTDLTEHRERGVASWYGHAFHGRPTSNGERFDVHGLSAAHKTLPIPSYVRVTHVRNGRSVVVRVNDRGPFSKDRVIDLSLGAAQRLGITQSGTAEVELQLLAAPQGFSSAMVARRAGAPLTASAAAAARTSSATGSGMRAPAAAVTDTTQPVADVLVARAAERLSLQDTPVDVPRASAPDNPLSQPASAITSSP